MQHMNFSQVHVASFLDTPPNSFQVEGETWITFSKIYNNNSCLPDNGLFMSSKARCGFFAQVVTFVIFQDIVCYIAQP